MKVLKVALWVFLATALASGGGLFYFRHIGEEFTASVLKPLFAWSLALASAVAAWRGAASARRTFLALAGAYAVYGAGDIVMGWGVDYTMHGMATFLAGHLLYTWALCLSTRIATERLVPAAGSTRQRQWLAVLSSVAMEAIAATVSYVFYDRSGLGVMALAGLTYGQCFVADAAVASRTLRRGVQLAGALGGTAMFLISDCTISIRRMVVSQPWMRPFIMATYYAALLGYFVAFLPAMLNSMSNIPSKVKKITKVKKVN